MTDQPSQRAMKAARNILVNVELPTHFHIVAAHIDAEFPAYLEIREALQFALECRHSAIDGLCRTCRTMAEAALAKARKD